MHLLYITLLSTVQGCFQHWQKEAKIVQYLYLTFFFFFKGDIIKIESLYLRRPELPMGLMFLARHV